MKLVVRFLHWHSTAKRGKCTKIVPVDTVGVKPQCRLSIVQRQPCLSQTGERQRQGRERDSPVYHRREESERQRGETDENVKERENERERKRENERDKQRSGDS